ARCGHVLAGLRAADCALRDDRYSIALSKHESPVPQGELELIVGMRQFVRFLVRRWWLRWRLWWVWKLNPWIASASPGIRRLRPACSLTAIASIRSEEHTSALQSLTK